MVPPSHSRISRYHSWIVRRPVAILIGALVIGALAAGLASRLKLKTAFSELLPSNDPGVVALIQGGSFYQLENTGSGPMILMGTRTGPNSANQHISYESGKDIRGQNYVRSARTEAAGH